MPALPLLMLMLAAGPHPASPWVHHGWGIAEGLPQSSANTFAQTDDGYLYVGTEEGLARFDGLRWETVASAPQLGGCREVTALAATKDSVWIGTRRCGVFRYSGRRFEAVVGPRASWVGALEAGPAGELWIGTAQEVWRRDPSGALNRLGAAGQYRALAVTADGAFVAAQSGLVKLVPGQPPRPIAGLEHAEISDLALGPDGRLWIGTAEHGLLRLDATGPTAVPSPKEIGRLRFDRDGALWVASRVAGLFRGRAGEALEPVAGFENLKVLDLFEDREGSTWIGTSSGGVHQLRPARIATLGQPEGLATPVVWSIAKDGAGNLWFGGDAGLLTQLDPTGRITSRHLPVAGESILEIVAGRANALWIVTGRRVATLDGEQLRPARGLPKGPAALVLRRDGSLWAGTPDGVFRERDGVFERVSVPALEHVGVFVMEESADGALWIGTQKGLLVLRDGRVEQLTHASGKPADDILEIREDSERPGVVWVGTGGGLLRVRGREVRRLTAADGLPDEPLFTLLDGGGLIWAATNHGILRLEKANLDAVLDGRAARVSATNFGLSDGMRSPECNGSHTSGVRTGDGQLWFATMAGAAHFRPGELLPRTIAARVLLTAISAGAEPLEDGGQLSPDAPNVELSFVAPTFVQPSRVRYRYRLDGFDTQWIEAGSRRSAVYTNLHPGAYRFRVQAYQPGGAWVSPESTLGFVRPPRMTEHRLFYPALLLLVLGVGAALFGLRVRQLHRRELWLERRVEERTAELRAALERVERSERTARIAERMAALGTLAAGVAHEINNPLAFVSSNIDFAVKELREIGSAPLPPDQVAELLSAMTDAGDGTERLRRIIGDLKTFSRAEAGPPREVDLVKVCQTALNLSRAAIKHRAQVVTELAPVPFVLGDEGRLAQVLVNLLVNAGQAIPEGAAARNRITARSRTLENGWAAVEVQDTGSGIAPENLAHIFDPFFTTKPAGEGTGLGLSICHGIVTGLGGRIEVESQPGRGTIFRVLLPPAPEHEEAPPKASGALAA